jgi:chromosome segregation ATPase
MTTAKVTHEVIRPIPGSEHRAGDRVDASGWRNREKLERARYLKPLEGVEGQRARAEAAETERDELKRQIGELQARVRELEGQLVELQSRLGDLQPQGRRAAAAARR